MCFLGLSDAGGQHRINGRVFAISFFFSFGEPPVQAADILNHAFHIALFGQFFQNQKMMPHIMAVYPAHFHLFAYILILAALDFHLVRDRFFGFFQAGNYRGGSQQPDKHEEYRTGGQKQEDQKCFVSCAVADIGKHKHNHQNRKTHQYPISLISQNIYLERPAQEAEHKEQHAARQQKQTDRYEQITAPTGQIGQLSKRLYEELSRRFHKEI